MMKCFPCRDGAALGAVGRCTLNGDFLACCMLTVLCVLSEIHTLQFLVFASLFQLRRLLSLLLSNRRVGVCRGPAVNTGSRELLCAAMARTGIYSMLLSPSRGETRFLARRHIGTRFLLCL